MKPTDRHLLVQAWVDDDLSPSDRREAEELLAHDPESQQLRDSLLAVRQWVRDHEPVRLLPESPAFHWSQIRRRIESEAATKAPARPTAISGVLSWLRWCIPVATAAVAAVLWLKPHRPSPSAGRFASENSVESDQAEASAVVFRSEIEGVTVHWLN